MSVDAVAYTARPRRGSTSSDEVEGIADYYGQEAARKSGRPYDAKTRMSGDAGPGAAGDSSVDLSGGGMPGPASTSAFVDPITGVPGGGADASLTPTPFSGMPATPSLTDFAPSSFVDRLAPPSSFLPPMDGGGGAAPGGASGDVSATGQGGLSGPPGVVSAAPTGNANDLSLSASVLGGARVSTSIPGFDNGKIGLGLSPTGVLGLNINTGNQLADIAIQSMAKVAGITTTLNLLAMVAPTLAPLGMVALAPAMTLAMGRLGQMALNAMGHESIEQQVAHLTALFADPQLTQEQAQGIFSDTLTNGVAELNAHMNALGKGETVEALSPTAVVALGLTNAMVGNIGKEGGVMGQAPGEGMFASPNGPVGFNPAPGGTNAPSGKGYGGYGSTVPGDPNAPGAINFGFSGQQGGKLGEGGRLSESPAPPDQTFDFDPNTSAPPAPAAPPGVVTSDVEGTASSGGAECFPAGVQVVMADGTGKRIERVVPGDRVLGIDFHTGAVIAAAVTETVRYRRGFGQKLLIINGVPVTTPHKWAVDADLWREAGDLRYGDKLIVLERCVVGYTHDFAEVSAISEREWQEAVYNLEVAGVHNFFVQRRGGVAYLVHNGGK